VQALGSLPAWQVEGVAKGYAHTFSQSGKVAFSV